MRTLIFLTAIMLTGCEAVPYVFNAAGFVTTQYLSSKRQDEILAKMNGYDNKLGLMDRKLDLMLVHDQIDTSSLVPVSIPDTGSTNGETPANSGNGDLQNVLMAVFGGVAGAGGLDGLMRLLNKLAENKQVRELAEKAVKK